MKNQKWESGVPIDAIRLCNVEGTLARIGNDMMNGEGKPTRWRKSENA